MPIPLFDKLISGFGGPYADANRVEVDETNFSGIFDGDGNIQQSLDKVDATSLGAPISFRTDDAFVLTDGNANQWFNREIRNNAATNAFRTLVLPSNAQITNVINAVTGRARPFRITISYTGGISNDITVNRLRITTNLNGPTIAGRGAITLSRGEAVVFEQAEDNGQWAVLSEALIQTEGTTPVGTVILQAGTTWDASDTASLPTANVQQGYAYEVSGAATGGTDVFGETVYNGDWVIWDNATFTAWSNASDWFVLPSSDVRRIIQNNDAFLTQVTRTGDRYDLSRNVFVNAVNVLISQNTATGVPLTLNYNAESTTSPATARTITFNDQAIQFANLIGGKLTLSVQFNATSFSGFPPELVSLVFTFGTFTFTFGLNNISSEGGIANVDIDILTQDYSSILNTNCNITLNYNFRGATFIGSFTITALVNTVKGTLHDPIVDLINLATSNVDNRIEAELNQIRGTIGTDEANFDAIADRISPYRNENVDTPDINARFGQSTGSDPFPAFSALTAVNPDNPQFTVTGTAVFIAVVGGHSYALRNITQNSEIALDSSLPNVDLGTSAFVNNVSYFIYRVSGLTANDVVEIERTTSVQVVAWQQDIDRLLASINRIDAELRHALLGLSDAVINLLEHELTVTVEDTPTEVATQYNIDLGDTDAQTVFREALPKDASGGNLDSNAISGNSGNDRYRQKLIYYPQSTSFTTGAVLSAFDGSTATDIVVYDAANNRFNARVFVPAHAGGTTTSTIYPAQATRVSGQGIWQTIPVQFFQNGVPLPEDDEIFFTRNIPTSAVTLTIQYRAQANGNIFGAGSATLANVGGASEVSVAFQHDVGSENVTTTVTYFPNFQGGGREIRVACDTTASNIGVIENIQVILSYETSTTAPATAATTRDVLLEGANTQGQVFAIKASSTNNLIIVGDTAEIDTGYAFTSIFAANENGFLRTTYTSATYLDYQDFNPSSATITDLQNHETLPGFGLFTTQYTHDTIAHLDTQLTVRNSENDIVNVGQELILVASDDTRWRLSVQTDGTLVTTQVT